MYEKEQTAYLREHLRNYQKEVDIANIAYNIACGFNKAASDSKIDPELVRYTAIVMNLGETDPRIADIYDSSVKWGPKEFGLNKLHGSYSAEMAEEAGIELSEEQKRAIAGHSKGEYNNSLLGQIIKIAEVCRATQDKRWFRGKEMPPATSWDEVATILKEDPKLPRSLIAIAGIAYGRVHFSQKEGEKSRDE